MNKILIAQFKNPLIINYGRGSFLNKSKGI